ncbi:hypothetical protein [Hyphococcus luteus]|uniref:Uncharacterized protein n=1 Tax=Hyphococcus luteus TaxID=2058213 RepID=A0A2S7K9H3_9PROT|nr:hypothetical protein [Marinicaulis flavus]PQA89142.1 hypothetical protein CW354_04135 [Marinicaulis flavus]
MGNGGVILVMMLAGAAGFSGALAQDAPDAFSGEIAGLSVSAIAGTSAVLAFLGVVLYAALTSRRLEGSSLFNRLFVVVAVTAGFFSAISSAIGFGLITSQEEADFLRNAVLPPAFGAFVFCLAVAIWVGGADFVRHRDWFRNVGGGFLSDILFFFERAIKLFIIVPALALILFFVSTWTTVVGIGGVDAVRHTYTYEIERLASECAGITAWRQRDYLFLEDLRLSVNDVTRVAEGERDGGAQSGAAGAGAVTDYFIGIASWYRGLEESVAAILDAPDPSGVDPYDPDICTARTDELKRLLARGAFDNVDRWNREFETAFNDFVSVLNRWRHDKRIERLLDQQLDTFARANPKPARVTPAQKRAIDAYAEDVEDALKSLIRSQKLQKPPVPVKSAAELSPARGLDIFREVFNPPPPPEEPEKVSRRQSVVDAEFVPGLSTISPRDAVLKHANIFSDVWALALSWDYAPYILMLAFLFFPSAERAKGYKD